MAAPSSTITLPFTTLDVFTSTRFTGNPLGLVLLKREHHSLPQETKQRIAREFNLSETVFLHVPSDEDAASATALRLDIFTRNRELPFAGHPTIGTASFLLLLPGGNELYKNVTTMNIKAGPIQISRSGTEDSVRAAIPHDVHIHSRTLGSLFASHASSADAEEALQKQHGISSVSPAIRAAELAAPVVSVVRGMTFLLAQLPSLEDLARAEPRTSRLDLTALPAPGIMDEGPWGEGFVTSYYFVLLDDGKEDGKTTVRVRSRMIRPGFEDPATGSAASALACYLTISGKVGAKDAERVEFEVVQGVEMGRRSVIRVQVERERVLETGGWKVKALFLGGTAVVVMKGTLDV